MSYADFMSTVSAVLCGLAVIIAMPAFLKSFPSVKARFITTSQTRYPVLRVRLYSELPGFEFRTIALKGALLAPIPSDQVKAARFYRMADTASIWKPWVELQFDEDLTQLRFLAGGIFPKNTPLHRNNVLIIGMSFLGIRFSRHIAVQYIPNLSRLPFQ